MICYAGSADVASYIGARVKDCSSGRASSVIVGRFLFAANHLDKSERVPLLNDIYDGAHYDLTLHEAEFWTLSDLLMKL